MVNLENLTLIGSGSEWFWSMAQFVVVVITLGGIYRQLRSQGAANAVQRIDSLQGHFSTERMDYLKLAVALELKRGEATTATMAKARPILDFFANLEDLYVHRYISISEVVDNWGRPLEVWSALLKPVIERQRRLEGIADIYDFKRLLVPIREEFRKRGIAPLELDDQEQAEWLDFIIDTFAASLRLHQEIRSGIIPAAPDTAAAESLLPTDLAGVDPTGPRRTDRNGDLASDDRSARPRAGSTTGP
jgi:hypothetical protein